MNIANYVYKLLVRILMITTVLAYFTPVGSDSSSFQRVIFVTSLAVVASLYRGLLNFITVKETFFTHAIMYGILVLITLMSINLAGIFDVALVPVSFGGNDLGLFTIKPFSLSAMESGVTFAVINGLGSATLNLLYKASNK